MLMIYTLEEAVEWLVKNPIQEGSTNDDPWSINALLNAACSHYIELAAAPKANSLRKLQELRPGALEKFTQKMMNSPPSTKAGPDQRYMAHRNKIRYLGLLGWGLARLGPDQIFMIWQCGAGGSSLAWDSDEFLTDAGVVLAFDPPVDISLNQVRVPQKTLLTLQATRAAPDTAKAPDLDQGTPVVKWTDDRLLALLHRYEAHQAANREARSPLKDYLETFCKKEGFGSKSNAKKQLTRARSVKAKKLKADAHSQALDRQFSQLLGR